MHRKKDSQSAAENTAVSQPVEDMESPAPVALRVDGFSKIYGARRTSRRSKEGTAGPVQALNDVSFTLTPGLYGLLGPNGAGILGDPRPLRGPPLRTGVHNAHGRFFDRVTGLAYGGIYKKG